MVLFQQLHRLPHHIAATARASRRAARFDAFHAVETFGHIILRPQFFRVEINILQNVDHRRLQPSCQGKGAVMLGVAADLQHPLAHHRKGRRQVGRGGRFANPPLAINRKDLGPFDLGVCILMNLNGSFPV